MRNKILVRGKSCSWIPGSMAKPEGRHVTLGPNNVTSKNCRKTKVGAARLLEQDDERRAQGNPMFSLAQREGLKERAGKAYRAAKAEKAIDPYAKLDSESVEEYVERIKALIG